MGGAWEEVQSRFLMQATRTRDREIYEIHRVLLADRIHLLSNRSFNASIHRHLSICLSIHLSIYLSIYPSIRLPIDASIHRSIHRSIQTPILRKGRLCWKLHCTGSRSSRWGAGSTAPRRTRSSRRSSPRRRRYREGVARMMASTYPPYVGVRIESLSCGDVIKILQTLHTYVPFPQIVRVF